MIYLLLLASVGLGLCLSELHQTRQDLAIEREAHRQHQAEHARRDRARRRTTKHALWGITSEPAPAMIPAPGWPVVDVDGHTAEAPLPALTTGGR